MNLDESYLHLLDGVSYRPIFILGPARSGTTLLYNLLASSGAFNVVTVYHIIHYDQLLHQHQNGETEAAKAAITAQFAQADLDNRGVDAVAVGAETPEEYGFVIRKQRMSLWRKLLTPYDGPFYQRIVREGFVNHETYPLLDQLCRKVQFLADNDKPLLLKNPPDFANLAQVRRIFPEAPCIITHRRPIDIVHSRVRTGREIVADKNPYYAAIDPQYIEMWQSERRLRAMRRRFAGQRGVRTIANGLVRGVKQFMRQRDAMGDVVEVRYEDLCADAAREIGRIFTYLNLPQPAIDLSGIRPKKSDPPPEITSIAPNLARKIQPYLTRYHY